MTGDGSPVYADLHMAHRIRIAVWVALGVGSGQ